VLSIHYTAMWLTVVAASLLIVEALLQLILYDFLKIRTPELHYTCRGLLLLCGIFWLLSGLYDY